MEEGKIIIVTRGKGLGWWHLRQKPGRHQYEDQGDENEEGKDQRKPSQHFKVCSRAVRGDA